MIEAEYAVEVAVPVEQVWRYVEVIENWAPFMIGYQRLTLVNDRRSIWTLRGDVGVLSRQVEIQADITRWEPLHRAEFTITGLTERITGEGCFELIELIELTGDAAETPGRPSTGSAPGGLGRRVRFAFARWLLRLVGGRGPAPRKSDAPATTDQRGRSRLSFRLQVAPAGPMAPMVELLMRPMVEPAAQDFLRNVRQALEQGGGHG